MKHRLVVAPHNWQIKGRELNTMTVHTPEPNILDRLLRRCRKTRGVIIPEGTHNCHGKEKLRRCQKESVFRTVSRRRGQTLPPDRADIFLLQKIYHKSKHAKPS